MKIWCEDEIVQELACRSTNGDTSHFVLILARKVHPHEYEFVYYSANQYERVDDLFEKTCIVLENENGGNDDATAVSSITMETALSTMEEASSDEPCFGKAIFQTSMSESPLKKILGSPGWIEAIQKKYYLLEAQSQKYQNLNNDGTHEKVKKNHTAVKAAAFTAIGGGATAGGTTLAAGAMGYTATGIAANSAAAAFMSAEAVAAGGGVAAGGFTATMQSIGTVGVLANPVGLGLTAAGALVGGLAYYGIHCRNEAKKKMNEEAKKKKSFEEQQLKAPMEEDTDDSSTQKDISYQRVPDEEETTDTSLMDSCWVVVRAKTVKREESQSTIDYVFSVGLDQSEGESIFAELDDQTVAKAIFDPTGQVVCIETVDPNDQEGWKTALALHFDLLVDNGTIEEATTNMRVAASNSS